MVQVEMVQTLKKELSAPKLVQIEMCQPQKIIVSLQLVQSEMCQPQNMNVSLQIETCQPQEIIVSLMSASKLKHVNPRR